MSGRSLSIRDDPIGLLLAAFIALYSLFDVACHMALFATSVGKSFYIAPRSVALIIISSVGSLLIAVSSALQYIMPSFRFDTFQHMIWIWIPMYVIPYFFRFLRLIIISKASLNYGSFRSLSHMSANSFTIYAILSVILCAALGFIIKERCDQFYYTPFFIQSLCIALTFLISIMILAPLLFIMRRVGDKISVFSEGLMICMLWFLFSLCWFAACQLYNAFLCQKIISILLILLSVFSHLISVCYPLFQSLTVYLSGNATSVCEILADSEAESLLFAFLLKRYSAASLLFLQVIRDFKPFKKDYNEICRIFISSDSALSIDLPNNIRKQLLSTNNAISNDAFLISQLDIIKNMDEIVMPSFINDEDTLKLIDGRCHPFISQSDEYLIEE